MSTVIDQIEAAPSALSRLTSDRTAKRIAAWCEAGLDATAVPFFPLLVLVPRGIAALVSMAGLCAAGLVLSTGARRPRPALVASAALLGCLLIWGTTSALWSADPVRSLVVAARLAGLFAIGLALAVAANLLRAPRRLIRLLLAGLVLGVAMAAIDLISGGLLGVPFTERSYQPAALNRASVSFTILLLPMTAMLLRNGLALGPLLFAAATVATIFALAGTTAKAALIAGVPIGLLIYLSPARVARMAAVLSVLLVVTAPLSFARLERIPAFAETADAVKLSAGHRLLIWSFAGDRIAERPLTGWGLDASRTIPGGSDPIRPGETWLPLHPHNAPLQLWLELGVPGAVLFALVVASAWRALADAGWPPLFHAAAGAGLTVAFVGCFATYGIWQEWWLDTLWFSLFLIGVMARVADRAALAEDRPGTIAARL